MNATQSAIKLIKNSEQASDQQLIKAVEQIIGYMPTQGIKDGIINSSDLRTDIVEFASLLK